MNIIFQKVDFQLCCHASPAMDIVYLLSTSLMEDVYQTKRDHLLNVYLETLGSVMSKLGCKRQVLSMDELKDSLVKFAVYELVITFTYRPIMCSLKEDAPDNTKVSESEPMVNLNILRNPTMREIVTNRLPVFDKLGLFD